MTREEFAGQVTEMTRSLYYVACSLLPVMADREDAIQNCIVKGLMRCELLRDESKLRPWITRVLINECYTILRQKKRVYLTADVPSAPGGDVDFTLRDAVEALPEKKRIALTLQLEGYTSKEIAQILRVPEGTVKTRLRDAKQLLRKTLGETEMGEVLA